MKSKITKTMLLCLMAALQIQAATTITKMMPACGAQNVNIDTHLTLIMSTDVKIGNKGFISVYDKQSGKLVDRLDMSIPAGPTKGQPSNPKAQYTPVPYAYPSKVITNRNTKAGTPSGVNAWDNSRYQLDIIGGFSDAFHFYPIIAHGNQATIYLHHNLLEYGHEYYVTIDKGVIEGFDGIKGKKAWTFSTKKSAPAPSQHKLVVAADGSGDFSTVQGAMDFIPDYINNKANGYEVFVKNGDYEELVYFRNKRFVTIKGQSRNGVCVHYPNNEVFNPHPADIKTNELKGTFPSRRAAFAADNCTDLIVKDITLKTDCKGQAEGLLVNGERNYFENVHVIGDGDALQANGSAYWLNCVIDGGGDTILGRGPSYFNHCTITSYGAFMWIRNTEENHGNIFVDCRFKALSEHAVLGRLPDNKGKNYPHAECVLLNCELDGVPAEGWGEVGPEASTATLLEFNSHTPDGRPIDTSRRHPQLRQLNAISHAALIAQYYDSKWVLEQPLKKTDPAKQKRKKYEFQRNLPTYAQALIANLTYPLAWGNSEIKDFGKWKQAARQKVFDCMLTPPPAPANGYNVKVLYEEQRNGYKARKLEIQLSQYYTVPAYVLIPNGNGPFPAINLLHDHGAHLFIGKEKMIRPLACEPKEVKADAEAWLAGYEGQFFGDYLAQHGYVVFSADAPMWGERGQKEGARRDRYDMIAGNMMMYGIDLSAYMTYDDIAGTEFLAHMPEVDPERIGCTGWSMGGYRAWMLSALSDHIKAGAAICWMVTTAEQMSDKYSRTENGGFANCLPGLRRWLDYPHVASIACPKPMLFINGSQDKLFPVAGVKKAFGVMHDTWKSQGAGNKLETELWEMPHSCPLKAQQRTLEFFDKYLK